MRSNRFLFYALLGAMLVHIVLFIGLSLLNNTASLKHHSHQILNLQHIAHTPTLAKKHQTNPIAQPNKPVKAVTKAVDKVITSNQSLLKRPVLSAIEPIEAITSTPQIIASTTNTNEIIKDSTTALTDTKEIVVTEPIFDADFLHNPAPAYPYFSRQRQQQGTVLLRVKVSIEGKAEAIELNKSSGFKLLDEVAQNTVKTWRFVPAKRGNNAVSAWVIVPITFELS
jgi:protein TonB